MAKLNPNAAAFVPKLAEFADDVYNDVCEDVSDNPIVLEIEGEMYDFEDIVADFKEILQRLDLAKFEELFLCDPSEFRFHICELKIDGKISSDEYYAMHKSATLYQTACEMIDPELVQ